MEKTYVMVKPEFANDPRVIKLVRLETAKLGLKIERAKFVKYGIKEAQAHYAEHFRGSYENAKGFYRELENYITSDKAYGMVISGEDAINKMRALIKVLRVYIPAKLGQEPRMTENVLHGSDCVESATKETAIFDKMPAVNEYSK